MDYNQEMELSKIAESIFYKVKEFQSWDKLFRQTFEPEAAGNKAMCYEETQKLCNELLEKMQSNFIKRND